MCAHHAQHARQPWQVASTMQHPAFYLNVYLYLYLWQVASTMQHLASVLRGKDCSTAKRRASSLLEARSSVEQPRAA